MGDIMAEDKDINGMFYGEQSMNIIIDTHIFLQAISEPDKLSSLKTGIII